MNIVEKYVKLYQEKRDEFLAIKKEELDYIDEVIYPVSSGLRILMEAGNEAMEFVASQMRTEFESEIDELHAK